MDFSTGNLKCPACGKYGFAPLVTCRHCGASVPAPPFRNPQGPPPEEGSVVVGEHELAGLCPECGKPVFGGELGQEEEGP